MNLSLYDDKMNRILMEKDYPDTYLISDGEIQESVTKINHPLGQGIYREIYFENVHIAYGDAHISRKMKLYFESDFETIEMHFALKGKSKASSSNADSMSFQGFQHNIIYANKLCGMMEWDSDKIKVVEINISPQFFKRFLPDSSPVLGRFRESIESQKTNLIGDYNNQINYEMYRVIEDIIACDRKGVFKKMFLEAKVIELLLLQLEQFCEGSISENKIHRSDIDKMYAVRDYILDNLNNDSSLIDLAHMVGTNEFKLKKVFKEVFGTTVFGFWNDAKMEQAREMLFESNASISDVSEFIGYKNPRHFSAAFKKKYGVIPSQIKK